MLSGFEPFAAVWEYAALSGYGRLSYQPPRSISPDEVTTGEVPTTELNRRVTAAFHCYQARTPPVPISVAPAPKTGILRVPPGLEERLCQFEEGIAGQPQAQHGFTIAAVHELAAVLYEKSTCCGIITLLNCPLSIQFLLGDVSPLLVGRLCRVVAYLIFTQQWFRLTQKAADGFCSPLTQRMTQCCRALNLLQQSGSTLHCRVMADCRTSPREASALMKSQRAKCRRRS